MTGKRTRAPILTERRLRWYYRLLSVPVTPFDCGRLCAPGNGGVPVCCDHDRAVPVLYRDEFEWHRERTGFWRKLKPRSKADRAFVATIADYCVAATCPGIRSCSRALRSIACRAFPFEPHLDKDGVFAGLTFNYGLDDGCPLYQPRYWPSISQTFIVNATLVWQHILTLLPDERELYTDESRALRRRLKQKGERVPLFR
jgi:hypothetical protein